MRKIAQVLFMLSALGIGSLFARIHPCPGEVVADFEFLYLLPSVDDTYFVIDSPEPYPGFGAAIFGKRINNELGFHPGFRVGGAWGFCNCERELDLFYTRLRAHETKTVSGSTLWPIEGSAFIVGDVSPFSGTATSDLDFLYEKLDVLVAQRALCICDLDLYLEGGIEVAYLRLTEGYTYNSIAGAPDLNTIPVNRRCRTWGLGPEFGIEVDYTVCQFSSCLPGTLSAVMFTSGSLLASNTFTKVQEDDPLGIGASLNTNDRHTWRIVPVTHARVGLNYLTCLCNFDAALEIGYEFNCYIRGFARTFFSQQNTSAGVSHMNYFNFDTQGLYLSANVGF